MSALRLRTPLLQATLALALCVAAPAAAQEADPIGALLDQPPPAPEAAPAVAAPPDLETADALSAEPPPAPTPPAYTPPPVNHAPPTPQASEPFPYRSSPVGPPPTVVRPPMVYAPPPPRPELAAPTYVDETGRSPEAPPNSLDMSYEARLRSSSASAQGLQGPLDGAWTLRSREGAALYSLQLVDNGLAPLEGAWRDPRRRGSTDSSGFVSAIQRIGGELIVSFYPRPGAGVATLVLNAAPDGSWIGRLEEGGQRRAVVLRRD